MRKRRNRVNIQIGVKLRELRHHRELSQEHVAARLGILRSSLVNIEKGRQNVSGVQLWKLASILEVPVGDIFNGVIE